VTNLNTEFVVACCKCRVQCVTLDVVTPPAVVFAVGTKVQRAGDVVYTSFGVAWGIAACFSNVNLTGARPLAVYIILGQHPNGRPKPISAGEFGNNFKPAVFDIGAEFGVDTARLDWVDDSAVGRVGRGVTVVPLRTSTSHAAKIDDGIVDDELLVLEGRLNDKLAVFEEDVFICACSHLKLAVATKR